MEKLTPPATSTTTTTTSMKKSYEPAMIMLQKGCVSTSFYLKTHLLHFQCTMVSSYFIRRGRAISNGLWGKLPLEVWWAFIVVLQVSEILPRERKWSYMQFWSNFKLIQSPSETSGKSKHLVGNDTLLKYKSSHNWALHIWPKCHISGSLKMKSGLWVCMCCGYPAVASAWELAPVNKVLVKGANRLIWNFAHTHSQSPGEGKVRTAVTYLV